MNRRRPTPEPAPAAPLSDAAIMVRANITRDEWTELRAIALRRNTTAAELVAGALRETYNLTGASKP